MMLAGLPVPDDAIEELAALVRVAGAVELANRLEQALDDKVKLLALSLDERRSCSPPSKIRRRSWPSSAPFSSPTTNGAATKGSTIRYAEHGVGRRRRVTPFPTPRR